MTEHKTQSEELSSV